MHGTWWDVPRSAGAAGWCHCEATVDHLWKFMVTAEVVWGLEESILSNLLLLSYFEQRVGLSLDNLQRCLPASVILCFIVSVIVPVSQCTVFSVQRSETVFNILQWESFKNWLLFWLYFIHMVLTQFKSTPFSTMVSNHETLYFKFSELFLI